MAKLTRDENKNSHFCVYFPAFDPREKEIFIGHHKKSGLWLVNGGHMDKGENIHQTLKREIYEEWGLKFDIKNLSPVFLTITKILHNPKIPCKIHFDIWFMIETDKNTFKPDKEKLDKEFFEMRWMKIDEAKKLTKDQSTIDFLSAGQGWRESNPHLRFWRPQFYH